MSKILNKSVEWDTAAPHWIAIKRKYRTDLVFLPVPLNTVGYIIAWCRDLHLLELTSTMMITSLRTGKDFPFQWHVKVPDWARDKIAQALASFQTGAFR